MSPVLSDDSMFSFFGGRLQATDFLRVGNFIQLYRRIHTGTFDGFLFALRFDVQHSVSVLFRRSLKNYDLGIVTLKDTGVLSMPPFVGRTRKFLTSTVVVFL